MLLMSQSTPTLSQVVQIDSTRAVIFDRASGAAKTDQPVIFTFPNGSGDAARPARVAAESQVNRPFRRTPSSRYSAPPPLRFLRCRGKFMQVGAQDPQVVSMKQTLYRTSSDSPMFHALTEAAQTKEVTVVVELMARFDEASNIRWARDLEDAGVQVFHGIVGLKTHCKLALLVRRDPDGVTRRYAHLGTGNYNPNTARFYTDISLLTADPEITASVHSVFNYLTAHSESDDYAPLLVAPLTLAESTIRMIHREAEHAAAGRPAHIIAKMNSLLEQAVIEALYASFESGRADRSDRARHLFPSPGDSGRKRKYSRALGRRPIPRAQPHLLFCQRRRGRDLLRQRRLDAAQPV